MAAARAVPVEPAHEVIVLAPGVPGISTIHVLGLFVMAVNGVTLPQPIRFDLISPIWGETSGGMEPEPRWEDGGEVVRVVDTSAYPYQMTCACGRVRYAKANSRKQITACRVCTRRGRLGRRARRQREQRS